ncbi:calcium/sodium antiporter [Neptunomonas qingdaonensis]|uniref:Cation:H+ antiporter n=1 Tax=Neptunomonas qingdaonensis TaxID=1045558 RepID=A0A1I2UTC1_9GAMM|nr:calcium/sodium antiporter [Neptunomonas qingdaonensis]SFG80233.1 cation:H+ antiporter [Neptunomonas qingdaonensis]
MLNLLYLLLGIGLLTAGGEVLIRGSLTIAKRLGISPLLSGLLIVGFGTSMPELVVSVDAAINGQPDIAIGNVVGSNIANILLILGVCALITPLAVSPLSLRRDAVVVIAASLLFVLLAAGRALSIVDGIIFIAALFSYLIWAYWTEKDKSTPSGAVHAAEATEIEKVPESALWSAIAVIGGLALLIAGSQVLLKGAVGIANGLGVSQAVIGLTLVAVGTSLPELTISVIAALRRHADVAVGNILGSNIFNLLGILGVSAIMQPISIKGRVLEFDQWVMLGAAFLIFLFLFTDRRLSRIEGGVLLLGYFAYLFISFFFIES